MQSCDDPSELIASSSPTRVNSRVGFQPLVVAKEKPIVDASRQNPEESLERELPIPVTGFHELGVAFENLSVYGSDISKREVESFEVSALRSFDIYRLIKKIFGIKTGASRALISGVSGVCPPGQSMIVLGRPGAGCSTLLRGLTNDRATFMGTSGHIQWGNVTGADADELAGELVFNNEEDIHASTLSVFQTLDSDLSLKAQHGEDKSNDHQIDRLLQALGMSHTKGTLVGDSYVRGVSGGERKRVSLLEILTTNPVVVSWDNCVRGLDSAVALHFLRVLKKLGRATGMSNIVSIYQASQDMYDECFDRVIVLYEGRMVFSGLTTDAETFFLEQGWLKKDRQTTADFLTSCTSVRERRTTKEGVPQTPDEMAAAFLASEYYKKLQDDIASYKAFHGSAPNTQYLLDAVKKSKASMSGRRTAFQKNFVQQVASLIVRQSRLTIADKATFIIRVASNAMNAVAVGAIAYRPPTNAAGAFATSGAIFFVILYFVIFGYGEVAATINSRPLQIKHRKLGFYHPGAVVIAQMVVDIPLFALQTLLFSSIYYFLLGLNPSAKYFFTFWFTVFTFYMTIANMYRMIGSWSPNLSVGVRYAGLALSVVLTTSGYILPAPYELGWIRWLGRASPGSYALESLLANEFRVRTLVCGDDEMVPSGPMYSDSIFQTCSITGAVKGQRFVSGAEYLNTKYGFHAGNIWRNVGILWAMYVIYTIFIVIGCALLVRDTGGTAVKLYKRQYGSKMSLPDTSSEELPSTDMTTSTSHVRAEATLVRSNTSIQRAHGTFTFRNVSYTVQTPSGDKRLLNDVSGQVRPGELTALMGASGAGKTTLLDVISQRKTTGLVEGAFSIGSEPLDGSFSRRAGFCMQADIHDSYATVRECLEFSALMRQGKQYSRAEKLLYVDEVMQLLELTPLADAIIGNSDIGGLGIEERKRVTIGVELAARPESILFLDEPTSGLDSQAAFEIISFLRKIASVAGLSVLCTIHQPSGDLFELFDAVVLLAPGGNTVYAGSTGPGAVTVCNYFDRMGAPIKPGANPAEHVLETIAPVGGSALDWPGKWKESSEYKALTNAVDLIAGDSKGAALGKSKPDFAASYTEQTTELVRRQTRHQWRNGSYLTSKFVSGIYFGLFIGFFYFKIDKTAVGIQALSLAQIIIAQSAPVIMIDIAFFYQDQFSLFIARERNGVFGWHALVTSLLITDIPSTMLVYILSFLCYFWSLGVDTSAPAGGLEFLIWIGWSVFVSTSGVLLGAVSPSGFSVAYILSFFWNTYNSLSYAYFPHSQMPSPFRDFFSWFNPLRYYYSAMLTADLSSIAITCRASELTFFDPPAGQTCGQYASSFLSTAAGYLTNEAASSDCAYCQYSVGQTYIESVGYRYDDRWRDWGLALLFILSNIMLAFGVTYLVRIRPLSK